MKKLIKWTGIFVVLTILLALVLSIFIETKDEAARLAASVSDWKNSLRVVRWSLIAVLALFWSEVCDLLAKYKGLSPEQIERAKTMKWRVIGALIVFEVLVIESLPTKLIEV